MDGGLCCGVPGVSRPNLARLAPAAWVAKQSVAATLTQTNLSIPSAWASCARAGPANPPQLLPSPRFLLSLCRFEYNACQLQKYWGSVQLLVSFFIKPLHYPAAHYKSFLILSDVV